MDKELKKKIVEATLKLNGKIEMNKMTFEHNNEIGTIDYYDGGYLEIQIYDKDKDDIVFYQQIETSHETEMIEVMKAFYAYLFDENQRDKTDKEHIKKVVGKKFIFKEGEEARYPRILISCSSGASSGYFASVLKKQLAELGIDEKIDAIDYMNIPNVQENYDVVFLAPQVTYKLKEYRDLYGENKFYPLNSIDYSTFNVEEIKDKLIEEVKD